MKTQPIVLTLIGHFDNGTWVTPVEGGRTWLLARPFDAITPLPGPPVPAGVATLVSLPGDLPGVLWGVRETVEEIANLVDARRGDG